MLCAALHLVMLTTHLCGIYGTTTLVKSKTSQVDANKVFDVSWRNILTGVQTNTVHVHSCKT